jgi:hypothetical protein
MGFGWFFGIMAWADSGWRIIISTRVNRVVASSYFWIRPSGRERSEAGPAEETPQIYHRRENCHVVNSNDITFSASYSELIFQWIY